MSKPPSDLPASHYHAAGGIVVQGQTVLVLNRPSKNEIRLPKGHIEVGETPTEAALREVREESGYTRLCITADLGTQLVDFYRRGRQVVRTEHYFLMELEGEPGQNLHEIDFEPLWLSWEEAMHQLSYEAEKEWVRRARSAFG